MACRGMASGYAARRRASKADFIRDYRRTYNVEKSEYISTYYRKWAAANPDKVRERGTAQAARRKQARADHTAAAECVAADTS